jgi:hypothetical protein
MRNGLGDLVGRNPENISFSAPLRETYFILPASLEAADAEGVDLYLETKWNGYPLHDFWCYKVKHDLF